MTMTRLLSLCAFFLISYSSPVFGNIIHRRVILGDAVILPSGENCVKGQQVSWIHRQHDDDKTRLVSVHYNGVFVTSVEYETRVKPVTDGNFSLVFNRTIYNDNGDYEYRCGDRVLTDVRLEIVIPFEESVIERQNATLRCHSVTTGEAKDLSKFIRWERDGTTVFELDVASGTVSYGPGFEARVSVSVDGYREGDLSLRLTGVQQEDQGVFLCFHGKDKERERGNPPAVKLTVRPPAVNKGEEATWTVTAVIAVVVTAVVFGALGWCLRSRRSNASTRTGGDVEISAGSNESESLDSSVH